MFNLVIELRSPSMVMIQTLGLVVDDVPGNAVCETSLIVTYMRLGGAQGRESRAWSSFRYFSTRFAFAPLGSGLDSVGVTLDRLNFRAGDGGLLALGDGAKGIGVALFVGVLSKSVPYNRLQA
ncbi:hypothetical protein IFM61606_07509 [Aspergillus udagawae]|uniref:Uncharacterized protein n=1 Tax=Aspergillus udagawae TaxID=91492 RepID=A0ABQ1BA84_9EURO|nr:hypothetical protein IFM53868_08962 [Aspergillus udagawae]GFG27472.1 hypothetical protein IFM61606_07509 [Aspergillus udagawae]